VRSYTVEPMTRVVALYFTGHTVNMSLVNTSRRNEYGQRNLVFKNGVPRLRHKDLIHHIYDAACAMLGTKKCLFFKSHLPKQKDWYLIVATCDVEIEEHKN